MTGADLLSAVIAAGLTCSNLAGDIRVQSEANSRLQQAAKSIQQQGRVPQWMIRQDLDTVRGCLSDFLSTRRYSGVMEDKLVLSTSAAWQLIRTGPESLGTSQKLLRQEIESLVMVVGDYASATRHRIRQETGLGAHMLAKDEFAVIWAVPQFSAHFATDYATTTDAMNTVMAAWRTLRLATPTSSNLELTQQKVLETSGKLHRVLMDGTRPVADSLGLAQETRVANQQQLIAVLSDIPQFLGDAAADEAALSSTISELYERARRDIGSNKQSISTSLVRQIFGALTQSSARIVFLSDPIGATVKFARIENGVTGPYSDCGSTKTNRWLDKQVTYNIVFSKEGYKVAVEPGFTVTRSMPLEKKLERLPSR